MPHNRDSKEKTARRMVISCAKRMAGQNWRDRRQTLEAALQSDRHGEDAIATGTMVASILARLDHSSVVDNDQALIFAMSANADHQAAACDWFIGQSLAMLADPISRAHASSVHGATIH